MIEHVAVSATCFFVGKARKKTWYFKSLSNRIGEDQFPVSKMKWGIFWARIQSMRRKGLIHRGFGVLIGKNGTVKLINIAPTEAPDRFRKPAQSQGIWVIAIIANSDF